jgi:Asp-tRNA(Asn)/Glu-tRNA(Gln) amidotransferase A subunit family amidase
MNLDLAALPAFDARDRMARGEFSAVDLCEAYIERVALRESGIGAFAFFDESIARTAAGKADQFRKTGRSLGSLHGIPVGVKDIIDTADMPSENGTVLDAGRRPGRDAEVVRRLRQAGAIVFGKTVTTELAYFASRKTRNPHDPDHTPGGSSSGSAAAVAAGMLPLAIGTQTFGSVIRPASFCGVVGFKPSFGLISRAGIRLLAAPLDTVGVFGRSIPDVAMLADAIVGHDPLDPDTRLLPPPHMQEVAAAEPPVTPSLAFVKTPMWEEADASTREGFAKLAETLGGACSEVALPKVFEEWTPAHRALMRAGMARNLEPYYRRGKDRLSEALRTAIEEGNAVTAVEYLAALDWRTSLANGLEQLFERFDAIITPAAPGEAPRGLDSTGNPIFNGLWTLCGAPAVTLPLLRGPNGLPVGVQLVGRFGEDGRLLRTARWLASYLGALGRHS